jgi:hypothetical protein
VTNSAAIAIRALSRPEPAAVVRAWLMSPGAQYVVRAVHAVSVMATPSTETTTL